MTKQMAKIPKIVVLGGGTGLSVLLRGLKRHNLDITAVVTVADDGGSTGAIRTEMGIPAVGDIRKVIAALSDVEPLLEELFQFRFNAPDESGGLHGHALGNLILAAMIEITGDFSNGVREMGKVLNVKGRVLPSTNQVIDLHAEMEDGTTVSGESKITEAGKRIKRVYMTPEDATPVKRTKRAIREADMIIIAPGSLYTSIIPNFLIPGIYELIKESKARKVYICNVMTQYGETHDYTAGDHLKAIINHAGEGCVDTVLFNNKEIPEGLRYKYQSEDAEIVKLDKEIFEKMNVKVIEKDFVTFRDRNVRHDAQKISNVLLKMIKKSK